MTNEDVVKGKIKQVEGKAQDALGNVTNSPEDNVEGKLKQAEGKDARGFRKSQRGC